MADHDPQCEQASCKAPESAFCDCRCDCALIARVRADERERPAPAGWGIPSAEYLQVRDERDRARDGERALLAHAEAVAARLVEVMCEQEAEWNNAMEESNRQWMETLYEARREQRALAKERDAARAEVAALREQLDALLRDESKWVHNIRREVLADLRARVEGLDSRLAAEEARFSFHMDTVAQIAATRAGLVMVRALLGEAGQ